MECLACHHPDHRDGALFCRMCGKPLTRKDALKALEENDPALHAEIMAGARECLGESARLRAFEQQSAFNLDAINISQT